MAIQFKLWILFLASISRLFFFHGRCLSYQVPINYSFMKDGSEAPTESYYDYIIVGGGTTGIPLATTLSNASRVLLLERGGSPYANSNITNLSGFTSGLCDPSPTSPAQHFDSEEGVSNVRARVLGGGTCINAGFYSRASQDFVAKVGWDAALVNKSYGWVEDLLVQEPWISSPWQSAARRGLVEAGVTPDNGFTYDHLVGTKYSGTTFDREGRRHTAADLLIQANPEGIDVFLNSTVHRILFTSKGKARPIAYGVIFTDSNGAEHKAFLSNGPKNEIVVSAGTIGSPQLLMLSGVGPKDHLQSLGIDMVIDHPFVGQGIFDNPYNAIYIPSPSPVEMSIGQFVGITAFDSYILALAGARFFTCPSTAAEETGTSSFRGGFIGAKVAKPQSRGHLRLLDTNPGTSPSVAFNYYNDREDVDTCVKGLRTIERVIMSRAFSKFRPSDASFGSLLNTTVEYLGIARRGRPENYSQSLEQYCKDTVMPVWHYHGSCQVGQVVDRDYRVLGVDALRVLDGSVFSASPGTNPQATLMMLGRYMGVKMQAERLRTDEASNWQHGGSWFGSWDHKNTNIGLYDI